MGSSLARRVDYARTGTETVERAGVDRRPTKVAAACCPRVRLVVKHIGGRLAQPVSTPYVSECGPGVGMAGEVLTISNLLCPFILADPPQQSGVHELMFRG